MRKVRVNIFDDEEDNLTLLKIAIAQRNCEVLTFDRPVVCPINQEKPDECINEIPCADIIITDYLMPQMTGIELLLQQQQTGCKIDRRNKALMTGNPSRIKMKMIEELGCAYFSKPIKVGALFSWLDECEKRIDLSRPVAIIRKEKRYPANIDVLYTYKYNAWNLYPGIIKNYSSRGLCLIAHTPFLKKQSVVIKNELPNGCTNAAVCWVKPMEAGLYMAGLMAE